MTQDEAARREYVDSLRRIQAAEESNSIQQALEAAREHLSMDAVYATSIGSQHQTIDSVAGDIGAMGLAPGLAFPLERTYCSRMLRGEISRVIPNTRAERAVQDLAATREMLRTQGYRSRSQTGGCTEPCAARAIVTGRAWH